MVDHKITNLNSQILCEEGFGFCGFEILFLSVRTNVSAYGWNKKQLMIRKNM